MTFVPARSDPFLPSIDSRPSQARTHPLTQNFHILSKITGEPPALPPPEHAGAHLLNAPLFERKHARAYLAPSGAEARDAAALRTQVARGAREALEEQYWDVLERAVQARPLEAQLGGDPSVANRVRAFVLVRHYHNGEWEDRIEVRAEGLYNVVVVADKIV
jgi:nuclear pore complex protein Nup93